MAHLRQFAGIPGLYFGPIPDLGVLEALEEQKFDCVWNLGKELSPIIAIEKEYVPLVLHGNIPDYGVPKDVGSFVGQLDKVVGLLRSGKKVFAHCFGGQGRTSLALASISVMFGASAEDALRAANSAAHGPDTKEQAEFVRKLEKAIRY
jgi:hypothetical protein